MIDNATCKSSLELMIVQKHEVVAEFTYMLTCNSECNGQNTEQSTSTMILNIESTSHTHLQNSGSQESLANGIAKEQEDAGQLKDKRAGKEDAAGASNADNSVSASGNHTPIRSSFEDVPGLAIR